MIRSAEVERIVQDLNPKNMEKLRDSVLEIDNPSSRNYGEDINERYNDEY